MEWDCYSLLKCSNALCISLKDDTMLEFQCHYREEKWPTVDYFEFVEYFFKMANSSREDEDCESPPCPTVEVSTTTSSATKGTDVSPFIGDYMCTSYEHTHSTLTTGVRTHF